MKGRIDSGDLITVSPITGTESLVDKAVLCRVRGEYYVHLVKAEQGDMYLIGNNRGGTNGWTPKEKVYGVVTKVER